MKRKNGARSCNPPDTENDGVDLNRNFGYKWAFDNIGSSARGCSEEYRGTAAFSEPETQAIRAVARRYAIASVLHWHGWGNDVAFPFSYDWRAPMTNEDLGMYQEFATEMAATNHYASGRAWESVGYTTNGEADDWGWGDVHAVSVTIEVGSSSDGFWPPPSRILPIASESVWPAHYLAWASGPMLQLDGVQILPNDDRVSAELRLTLQNNGLASFSTDHLVCAQAVPSCTALRASNGWTSEANSGSIKLCLTLHALGSRSYRQLPALSVSWKSTLRWIPLVLTVNPPDLSSEESAGHAADVATLSIQMHTVDDALRRPALRSARARAAGSSGGSGGLLVATAAFAGNRSLFAFASTANGHAPAPSNPGRSLDIFRLRIFNSMSTLRGCDELCVCSSADNQRIDFSHECRASVPSGSHCMQAKPAHSGTNWASGVLDEHFVFVASSYSRGGHCIVSSAKKDTLLAVYASCSRFGAQSPLGFANSENGRTATVAFSCAAGTSYYLFWNAEYMPGRFPFAVTETCSGSECLRAHRLRQLMRLRFRRKQRME